MARFKVSTERLRAAAHECRVGAGQLAIAAECHREAGRWGPEAPEDQWRLAEHSLLASIQSGHEGIADMLQRRLEKASTVLTRSARALAEAARKYDAGNAEAVRLLEPEAGS